jgi:hypothetical protein
MSAVFLTIAFTSSLQMWRQKKASNALNHYENYFDLVDLNFWEEWIIPLYNCSVGTLPLPQRGRREGGKEGRRKENESD